MFSSVLVDIFIWVVLSRFAYSHLFALIVPPSFCSLTRFVFFFSLSLLWKYFLFFIEF